MRQTNVANLVGTANTMSEINLREATGELTDAQAEFYRQRAINAAGLDKAHLDYLKAEADKLNATNPGAKAAQDATTRYHNALAKYQEFQVTQAEKLGTLPYDLAKANLEKVQQEVEQGKMEHTLTFPDGTVMHMNTPQAVELLKTGMAIAARGQLTPAERAAKIRQTYEDMQKDEMEASNAESTITLTKNKNEDISGPARTYNSRSRDYYVYVPQKPGKLPWSAANNVKVPLPIRPDITSGITRRMTAQEATILWRNPQYNPQGLEWREFIKFLYNELRQPIPKEIAD